MDLLTYGISQKHLSAMQKKNIVSDKDLVRVMPRRYYDFTRSLLINENYSGKTIAITGELKKIESKMVNGVLMTKASILQEETNRWLNVVWWKQYVSVKECKTWVKSKVIVCGKLKYDEDYKSFSIMNPMIFSNEIEKNMRIVKVYEKIKGLSEESLESYILKCLDSFNEKDELPEQVLKEYGIYGRKDAMRKLHKPNTSNDIRNAIRRLVFDDLLYFALKLELEKREMPIGSAVKIKTLKNTIDLIHNLPFTLTADQDTTFNAIIDIMRTGKRVNGLIQGDVSCGKTIVAILLMFSMADSGYQSVLMAPTQVLAKQHYLDIKSKAEKYGYQVAYIGGKQKASEKREILSGIKDGKYQFIVGTHSVASEKVDYNNLALAITDEEHKFGVAQRKSLSNKSKGGVHTITMSATPIPRTMAQSLYGEEIQIYNIMSMPNGRKPVKTTIYNNEKGIISFLMKQIKEGRQAYVVCPLIEDKDSDEVSNVLSVEKTVKIYEEYFKNTKVKIASVTGKTPEKDAADIIADFEQNKYQILISTTVIEVGVNVPNASLIIINNAENFGLSSLHQLRGRVGRGKDQAYCILCTTINDESSDTMERLRVLEQSTNGFEIAEKDFEQRGSGSMIGVNQSGEDKYINLMLSNKDEFKRLKQLAVKLVDDGTGDEFIKEYEEINYNIKYADWVYKKAQ